MKILIVAGMQKSGSAALTHQVIHMLGENCINERLIAKRKWLKKYIRWENYSLKRGVLSDLVMIWLLLVYRGETKVLVLKQHCVLRPLQKLLLRYKYADVFYIYRDPTAVAVSLFNHGLKMRQMGMVHSFAKIESYFEAFDEVVRFYRNGSKILRNMRVKCLKYEEFTEDPLVVGSLLKTIGCVNIDSSLPTLLDANALHVFDRSKYIYPNSHETNIMNNKFAYLYETLIPRFNSRL